MNTLKKCLPDAIVVALFAVISFAYFLVPVSQGKILFPPRFASRRGHGTGTYRVRTTYWRGNTMDQLAFQWYCRPIKYRLHTVPPMDFRQLWQPIIFGCPTMFGSSLPISWASIFCFVRSISASRWLHWAVFCEHFLPISLSLSPQGTSGR